MFTPEHFRNLIETTEALLLRPLAPEELSDTRRLLREATLCRDWMVKRGIPSAGAVGPFAGWVPQKGERVLIRKGAMVHNCGPTPSRLAGRSRVVSVHRVDQGHFFWDEVRNPTVWWIGASRYWHWTDLNDVQRIA